MLRALDGIAALRRRAEKAVVPGNREYNPGWHTALDLHSLLTVSEAVTRAAIVRKESRGAHSRLDYPDLDDAHWGQRNSVIARDAKGAMTARTSPLPALSSELQALLGYEFFKVDDNGNFREFDEQFGPEYRQMFLMKLDDLAQDLKSLLEFVERQELADLRLLGGHHSFGTEQADAPYDRDGATTLSSAARR
jgi:hypothetical protein